MNILQLLASLSILVFIHELGHFFFARVFGTRVEKFYLFFNPWFSLFKWKDKHTGTTYGLGWLPLGGYCQIAGMVDESMDTEQLKSEPKPDEFRSKKSYQRLLIMAGGIIFNLILAIILYTGVALTWGDERIDTTDIYTGWTFSPAAKSVGFVDKDIILSIDGKRNLNALNPHLVEEMINAERVTVLRNGQEVSISIPKDMMQRTLSGAKGFCNINLPFIVEEAENKALIKANIRPGDQLIKVDSIYTANVQDAIETLSQYKGKTVSLQFQRADSIIATTIQIDASGKIGVRLRSPYTVFPTSRIQYGFIESFPAGFNKFIETISNYVGNLKHIFTKEGAKSLGGLGSMAQLFPNTFSWESFWSISAFFSVILAVMNLLPIPALDGGHILFILIEMLTGKKPNDKVMGYIQMSGMIFLLLLMLYANGNDIYRFLIK